MGSKFWNTLGGISWMVVSLKILFAKQFYARHMYFDFSNNFINLIAGIGCFLFGVAWLFATYHKRPNNDK